MRTRYKQIAWLALAAYAGFLIYGSNQSIPPILPPESWGPSGDKIGHALAYGGLAILLHGAMQYSSLRWAYSKTSQVVWLTILGFGVTDELHQSFIPGRAMDPVDWAADAIGSAIAILLLALAQCRIWPSILSMSPGKVVSSKNA